MSTNDMLSSNRSATPSVAPHPANKPGAGIPENALTMAFIILFTEKHSALLLFFFEIIFRFFII